jgi:adenine phosphoribosyltransferase
MTHSGDISIQQLSTVGSEDAQYVISLIRSVVDFPNKGILFRDFLPVLADSSGLSIINKAMLNALPVSADEFDAVAGLEARGFLLGPQMAASLNKGFIALRKSGKLPPETLSQSYSLEYGSATIEMEKDALRGNERVLIVDDLIATGGSAAAAAQLIERAGGSVAGFSFVMELEGLQGRELLHEYPTSTLVSMPA